MWTAYTSPGVDDALETQLQPLVYKPGPLELQTQFETRVWFCFRTHYTSDGIRLQLITDASACILHPVRDATSLICRRQSQVGNANLSVWTCYRWPTWNLHSTLLVLTGFTYSWLFFRSEDPNESRGVMLSCSRLFETGRCCYYSRFDWKCILNYLNDMSDFEFILVCHYKMLACIMETMWKANNSMNQELELFRTKLCLSSEFCTYRWLRCTMESTLSSVVHAGLVLFGFCKDVSSW